MNMAPDNEHRFFGIFYVRDDRYLYHIYNIYVIFISSVYRVQQYSTIFEITTSIILYNIFEI